jgi:protein involved in polysaccharide export with SLBB domain
MTLQTVLAKAGGFMPEANPRKVLIARADASGTLHKMVLDATQKEIALQPQDMVMVVDTRRLVKIQKIFDMAATLLRPVLATSFILRNIDTIWDFQAQDNSNPIEVLPP